MAGCWSKKKTMNNLPPDSKRSPSTPGPCQKQKKLVEVMFAKRHIGYGKRIDDYFNPCDMNFESEITIFLKRKYCSCWAPGTIFSPANYLLPCAVDVWMSTTIELPVNATAPLRKNNLRLLYGHYCRCCLDSSVWGERLAYSVSSWSWVSLAGWHCRLAPAFALGVSHCFCVQNELRLFRSQCENKVIIQKAFS